MSRVDPSNWAGLAVLFLAVVELGALGAHHGLAGQGGADDEGIEVEVGGRGRAPFVAVLFVDVGGQGVKALAGPVVPRRPRARRAASTRPATPNSTSTASTRPEASPKATAPIHAATSAPAGPR